MIPTIVNAILNWLAVSVLLPASTWLLDYWRIKKENKKLKTEIDALKASKTIKEKEDASDSVP